jgi:putative hydrolase of HD superfamily
VHNGKYIQENDTEHSYNLAMTAWYLAAYFPELDKNKLIRYALVHDLVEIHAGDTFAFGDAKHIASKSEREAAALNQLGN